MEKRLSQSIINTIKLLGEGNTINDLSKDKIIELTEIVKLLPVSFPQAAMGEARDRRTFRTKMNVSAVAASAKRVVQGEKKSNHNFMKMECPNCGNVLTATVMLTSDQSSSGTVVTSNQATVITADHTKVVESRFDQIISKGGLINLIKNNIESGEY